MSAHLAEGFVFAGRYRVVRPIAVGGMGAVYEVVHLETERRRALKVMHAHFVHSSELRDRFKSEARVAAKIDSDYIVDVFDAGIDEATEMPFLVMELLKGEELGKRLERQGKFSPAETLDYLWQTALALDKTHKANIVHRDLKPENLFLTLREDGPPRIKVLDFGVAKFVAETGTQTNVTSSVGTPMYMAPEQFRGQNISPASDNYALAMMAFTMLVGEAYWKLEANAAPTVFAFAIEVQQGPKDPASVRAARRDVVLSPEFDRWFAAATRPVPADRFASATSAIVALGKVLGLDPASRGAGTVAESSLPRAAPASVTPPGSLDPKAAFVQSNAVFGVTQPTHGSGVVAPVRSRSRFGIAVLGVLVVAGLVATARTLSRAPVDAALSATPALEVSRPASTPAVVAPAPIEPSAAPVESAAPVASAAPSAAASAEAKPAGRALPRTAPRPPTAKPAPSPASAPAAPTPTAKEPLYSRD